MPDFKVCSHSVYASPACLWDIVYRVTGSARLTRAGMLLLTGIITLHLCTVVTASVQAEAATPNTADTGRAMENSAAEQTAPAETPTTPQKKLSPIQRLNQRIATMPQLYLPMQLRLGEVNALVLRSQPNQYVRVYLSNSGEGFTTESGLSLRVGAEHQVIEGVTNEKGTATLPLELPDEKALDGQTLYIDAMVWSRETPAESVELVDASGRRTSQNGIKMAVVTDGSKGAMFFPTMPGMSDTMLRNLNTMSETMNADDRKKELLYDGTRDSDNALHKNTFIQPNGMGGSTLGTPNP